MRNERLVQPAAKTTTAAMANRAIHFMGRNITTAVCVPWVAFAMSGCRLLRDPGCKTATLHVQHLLERELCLLGNDAQQPVRRRPRQGERVQFLPHANPFVRG